MNELIERFPIVMVLGVLLVVGLSQINRLLGSILGVVFWIAMAAIGSFIYDAGGAIGIASVRFPQPVFLGLCGLLLVANLATGYNALKRRRAAAEPID